MNFGNNSFSQTSKKIVGFNTSQVNNIFNNEYPYSVNFYTIPPFGKTTLEESEDMVEERLSLLQIIDEMMLSMENTLNFKRTQEYFETLENKLRNAKSKSEKHFYLQSRLPNPKGYDARKRDLISHYLLRIYYCQSDELKKWFISRECELLRIRLWELTKGSDPELPAMLAYNGFNYEQVSQNERSQLWEKIYWNPRNRSTQTSESIAIVYKLAFEEALETVKTKRAFLHKGFAYIMFYDMLSVICAKFRAQLSHSLTIMQLSLHQTGEEKRLIPILNSLHFHNIEKLKISVKSEDDSGREVITPEMVNTLAVESFPPCMRNIHEMLRKENHLRHYGRLHYGLFLKSCGLSLDDAIRLFREEFTKKITPEKFLKEYTYNIRYNYGKEGKKTNLSAYSCQKIIQHNPPGPGDSHGCPFKHFDNNNLKLMLHRYGIDDESVQDILETVENEQNYSSACSKYFSCKHKGFPAQPIYHPNQYFTESRRVLKMAEEPMQIQQ